jgi:hypothetical protein
MLKFLPLLKKLLLVSIVIILILIGAYFTTRSRISSPVEVVHSGAYAQYRKNEQKDSSDEASCPRPSSREIEDHFQDEAGSRPVATDFDAAPGEICGNGRTFYCASRNKGKPIPVGWSVPPLPGTDSDYQGPSPYEEFKESPYAMPASKRVLARPQIIDAKEPAFKREVFKKTNKGKSKIAAVAKKAAIRELGLPEESVTIIPMSRLKTSDDKTLAEELLAQGIGLILLDRTLTKVSPWIEEEYDSLHIRLRDALETEWLHPLVIGSGMVLYQIAKPFDITPEQKEELTSYTRSLMKEVSVPVPETGLSPAEYGMPYFRVIVSLRWREKEGLKGRKFVQRVSRAETLPKAIETSVHKIRNEWDKISLSVIKDPTISVTMIPDTLIEAVDEMEIELEVLYDTATITDRTVRNTVWNFELGLHGVIAWYKNRMHYLEPAYAVHMEVKSEVQFIEQMLKKRKLKKFLRDPKKKSNQWRQKVLYESQWENDKSLRLERFRTVHWVESLPEGSNGQREIVELYRGVPLVPQGAVSKESLIRSLKDGAAWLVNYQTEDGQYAYKYSPVNKPGKRWEAGGNIVRHALNPYTLLMVYKITRDRTYLKSAKKGIDFTLSFLRRDGNRCVICHRDPPAPYYNAKMGTVAVTILSLLKLGEVEDISEYHEVLKCFGEQLLFMQNPNGHFRLYDVPLDHPYYGSDNTIAPGELIFALSRLYTYFRDERYKESIDRALPWYMKAWRHQLARTTKEGIYTEEDRANLIGIVPWMVTAMNDLHASTGEKKYADIAFEQQDWIDKTFFYYPNRSKYPDYVGASFKMHYELPAINSCQYAEGAAAAYSLGVRTNKKDLERMKQVVLQSMRFCLQLQFTGYDNSFFIPQPEEAFGGYRYTLGHLRLRNDYSYHAMAAIAQAVEYLREEDY